MDGIADKMIPSDSDFDQDGVRDQSHPKLYFGKWKHATYEDPQTDTEKNVYGGRDFRNDDYYFMAYNNLRNAADPSVLDCEFHDFLLKLLLVRLTNIVCSELELGRSYLPGQGRSTF